MAKKPKKLILVVHGIGEQAAGETLDDLAGAASEKNKAARVQSKVRWLADEHDMGEGRDVELFPCHIRRVNREKSELVFSEVFWAICHADDPASWQQPTSWSRASWGWATPCVKTLIFCTPASVIR